MMFNSLSDITQITIDRGKGVLAAIVKEARKNGVSFTRRELGQLGNQVCTKLDQDKLRKECIVQPGQTIDMPQVKKPIIPSGEHSESGVLAGYGGVTKTRGINGKTIYSYSTTDGKTQELRQS